MLTIKQLRDNLNGGAYDEKLAWLYCRDIGRTAPLRDRVRRTVERYGEIFNKEDGSRVVICSAPGRTELGGNHTDHQRGKVLTGSVDLDALACAAPNGTTKINVYSQGYGLTTVDTASLTPVKGEESTTAALIRGVAAGVGARGYSISGFDTYVASDVPGGSGLSSSACFEVLLGVVMNELFCGGALTPVELAGIGQYAENIFFGKPSGLLDQMGCAVGGIIAIDFKDREHPVCRPVNYDFASSGYALCIIDTGADHAGLTADYAAIPAEMEAVAKALGGEVLAQADEEEFYAAIPRLREKAGDRAVLRAMHYFDDCKRVERQVAALERGDFDAFLALVRASGRSSQILLQNISTYRNPHSQPVGVALAVVERLLSGRGAVRVHGGGFAGTIQAYVPAELLAEFRAGMDALLGKGACRVTSIRPAGGVVLLS